MKNTRNNVAYIDGANLHKGVGTFDWKFDYKKYLFMSSGKEKAPDEDGTS